MKIGLIGVGNMGGALLKSFLHSESIANEHLAVADKALSADGDNQNANEYVRAGVKVFENNAQLASFADIVIIAVKPKDVEALLSEIKDNLENKALISIAAGATYAKLSGILHSSTRVLAALPNTPVCVGAGVIGCTNETTLLAEEKEFVSKLFSESSLVLWVNEQDLGALSAISGSGPAFVALFAKSLEDAAKSQNLPAEIIPKLVAQTIYGTGKQLLDTGISPADLQVAVCSPGGTSIQGINSFLSDELPKSVDKAIAITTLAWQK